MTETIPCPKHGDKPGIADEHGFTMCRGCWYVEWLRNCLLFYRRSART